jgi:hypothetical protein
MAWPYVVGSALGRMARPLWGLARNPSRLKQNPFRGARDAIPPTTASTGVLNAAGQAGTRVVKEGVPGRTAGWLNPRAHKGRVAGVGAGLVAAPWMFSGGGDEQMAQEAFATSGLQGWQPPSGVSSYAEYEAEEGKRMSRIMKKALQQYMVISFAAGPEAAKTYLGMVDKIVEQGAGTRQKSRQAKIYDAVFGDKNNLPKSAEQVYNRMTTAGASPQYAAEISGYVGEARKADVAATGRVSQSRQIIAEIRKLYLIDKDLGARRLVEAWSTDLLGEKPIGDYQVLLQKAHEVLSGTAAGELAGDSMVTGIRVKA